MKIVLIILVTNITVLVGQTPVIDWQKSYGGSESDIATSIVKLPNGEYVICGFSESDDGDVVNHHGFSGGSDFWIYKIDSLGTIIWSNCLGGTLGEEAYSLSNTYDGGFLVVGTTTSNDFDVSGLHGGGPFGGNEDLWVVKTDSVGNLIWQKCFGGTYIDNGSYGEQTSDSGYVIIGSAESNDGDVVGSHGLDEIFILRLDKVGNIIWKKVYGGTGYDDGIVCKQLPDGNFIVAAYTTSNDGNISGNHNSSSDAWLSKLDTNGNIIWSRCYGGSGLDGIKRILVKNDDSFILCGSTTSNDGDVSGQHGLEDIWVAALSFVGDISWQACYGGSGYDRCNDAILTNDGGIALVGSTTSIDGHVLNHRPSTNGFNDFFVMKTDSVGNLLWSSCFGGSGNDFAYSLVSHSDMSYLIGGSTTSSDYDVTFNHGFGDSWIVKIEEIPNEIHSIHLSKTTFDCVIRDNNLVLDISNLPVERITVAVFDISGRLSKSFLLTGFLGDNHFELPFHSAQGMYFVRIEVLNSYLSKKVVSVY